MHQVYGARMNFAQRGVPRALWRLPRILRSYTEATSRDDSHDESATAQSVAIL